MIRKSREEKTMEHGDIIVEDLKILYTTDSEAYKEYKKLLNEYKKVTKRFSKTVSMSDSVGKHVIMKNETLKENVTYTVQKAREKILYNIEEHRKTKKVLAKYSDTGKNNIATLENEIRDLKKYIVQLESKSNRTNEVHHQFDEDSVEQINVKDINSDELKNISYQKILTKYITFIKEKKINFSVAKLSIDDFNEKIKFLNSENSTSNTIIKVLYKFFITGLGSKNIVYYSGDNIFYFLFPNSDSQESKNFIDKINVKRKLLNVTFTFSIGITQCTENDKFEGVEERLTQAHLKASKEFNTNSSCIA